MLGGIGWGKCRQQPKKRAPEEAIASSWRPFLQMGNQGWVGFNQSPQSAWRPYFFPLLLGLEGFTGGAGGAAGALGLGGFLPFFAFFLPPLSGINW